MSFFTYLLVSIFNKNSRIPQKLYLFLTLLAAFALALISGCQQQENTPQQGAPSSFPLPLAIQAANLPASCSDTISAWITIDSRNPARMEIIGGKANYTINDLSLETHQFAIEFRCMNTNPVVLATDLIVKTLTNDDKSVVFDGTTYTLTDDDNDNVSNIRELELGTDLNVKNTPITLVTPSELKLAQLPTSCSSSLSAWISIDSAAAQQMSLLNNLLLYDPGNISGTHDISLSLRCTTSQEFDLIVATLNLYQIVSGENTLTLSSASISFPDFDLDNISNLDEIIAGSNPADAPQPTHHLDFLVQPGDSSTNYTLPSLTVRAMLADGTINSTTKDSISLSFAYNPTFAKLSGTLSKTFINGVASFSDISIDLAGAYRLKATDVNSQFPTIISNGFNIKSTLPSTIWTNMNVTGAPEARHSHSATWTGNEIIVWGGNNGSNFINTGGVFYPDTNTWETTKYPNLRNGTGGAPSIRYYHAAVWTGTKLIIWGGADANGALGDGAMWDKATDTWTAISTVNAPAPRSEMVAKWSGNYMLVRGGYQSQTKAILGAGGIFDPLRNLWMSNKPNFTNDGVANEPEGGYLAGTEWTGDRFVVWGGYNSSSVKVNTGSMYDLENDTWKSFSVLNAPTARMYHDIAFDGTNIFIYGGDGYETTGGLLNLASGNWLTDHPGANTGSPLSGWIEQHRESGMVWTGSKYAVWGGARAPFNVATNYWNELGIYDPATDAWSLGTAMPAFWSLADINKGRRGYTTTWTGKYMVIWGGVYESAGSYGFLNNGALLSNP